jgi:hypothetical protein
LAPARFALHVTLGQEAHDDDSRDIPAEVVRAVYLRDGDQCAFIGRSGRRCQERRFLQLHHIDSYALGGGKTLDELSVRCRRHNVYESELVFGPHDPSRGGPSTRRSHP